MVVRVFATVSNHATSPALSRPSGGRPVSSSTEPMNRTEKAIPAIPAERGARRSRRRTVESGAGSPSPPLSWSTRSDDPITYTRTCPSDSRTAGLITADRAAPTGSSVCAAG